MLAISLYKSTAQKLIVLENFTVKKKTYHKLSSLAWSGAMPWSNFRNFPYIALEPRLSLLISAVMTA